MSRPLEAAPVGAEYFRLTVLGDAEPSMRKCGKRLAMWRVGCVCGKEFAVAANSIKRGKTKSCGCLAIESAVAAGKAKRTHGESSNLTASGRIGSPEYIAWKAMKQRCLYPKHIMYANYGGAGIKVCERWLASFENFLSDMGRRPSDGHTLDRIDSDKNYSPENCRWATRLVQSQNRRNVILNYEKADGIRTLRSQTGWGSRRIAKHLGLPRGSVVGVLYLASWSKK